jgi:hypothetical protein
MRPTTTTTLVEVPGAIVGMQSAGATQELKAGGFRVATAVATAPSVCSTRETLRPGCHMSRPSLRGRR